MPREGRVDAPGALQHVIQRGIARGRIFQGRDDYEAFTDRLGKVLEECGASCAAWALLPNHLHLLLRTGREPLGRLMQRLLTWYAGYFNRRNRRSGHLFQNRFKSILCDREKYFLELVRYIHLNPVRAGLARSMKDLLAFKWCGHGALMGVRVQEWQDTGSVLGEFGRTKDHARRRYLAFVKDGFDGGHRAEFEGRGVLRRVGGVVEYVEPAKEGSATAAGEERLLGDERFVDAVMVEVERRERRRSELRRKGWDLARVAERAADETGLELSQMRGGGKTPGECRARALACYWAVAELGYSGAAVASFLDIGKSAVSSCISRGRRIAEREKISLEGR